MQGYLNLFILGCLPWLIINTLTNYFSTITAVFISLAIIAPSAYKAAKQYDYISLIFVSGFLSYDINLLYHNNIFAGYSQVILLIIGLAALLSVALKKPFTIVYAKSMVSSDKWNHPVFIKINNIISIVWASIFLIEYILKAINFPHYIIINTLLIVVGFKFSSKYPDYYRKHLMEKNHA